MFFHIGHKKLDNYHITYLHDGLQINLDAGWHYNGNVWYKGYVDDMDIHTSLPFLITQDTPVTTGNYCIIRPVDSGVRLITDRYRSFPMYWSLEQGLTNLQNLGKTTWTGHTAYLHSDGPLIEKKYSYIDDFDTTNLSLEQCVDRVEFLLDLKFSKFFAHNKLPVKIFLSGGIDTMLLYAYLLKHDIPHEVLTYNHIDIDYFYSQNHDTLQNHWGYKQLHHWKEDCLLVSGTPGDEFTVRNPIIADMLLHFYGSSLLALLNEPDSEQKYHYHFFKNPKYSATWAAHDEMKFPSLDYTIKKCLKNNFNDWQHWHLGHTLTWTPLRDPDIFVAVARLEYRVLKEQIMDAVVQRELIKRIDPNLLLGISQYKNTGNTMANLHHILNF